jgi:site-specific recombinase XerD
MTISNYPENSPQTIQQVVSSYLNTISLARSANTARTYTNALNIFFVVLKDHGVKPEETSIQQLGEESVSWMINSLKDYSATTERLYLTATASFFEYVSAENLSQINLPRIRMLIHQRARRPGQRLPQFPKDNIELVLEYAETLANKPVDKPDVHLRNLRDRAFLIILADTGLRVHEACNMRRGDLEWNEGRAIIIGKGNRQAVVRFSRRAQIALRDYFAARAPIDGASGRPLSSLPLFARHDRGAGKKIKPITTATGRNIVNERTIEALGSSAEGHITPHSFRHYFVTRVLQSSGNLKLAQELARHKNIAVTQRYAHLSDNELDQGYWKVFEEDQSEQEKSV